MKSYRRRPGSAVRLSVISYNVPAGFRQGERRNSGSEARDLRRVATQGFFAGKREFQKSPIPLIFLIKKLLFDICSYWADWTWVYRLVDHFVNGLRVEESIWGPLRLCAVVPRNLGSLYNVGFFVRSIVDYKH